MMLQNDEHLSPCFLYRKLKKCKKIIDKQWKIHYNQIVLKCLFFKHLSTHGQLQTVTVDV